MRLQVYPVLCSWYGFKIYFSFLFVLGTSDFLGLNFYSSSLVRPDESRTDQSFDDDKGTSSRADRSWLGLVVVLKTL